MDDINDISRQIIGKAYMVYNTLGPGFLEKVYENSLAYELKMSDLSVSQQQPINVYYEEQLVGIYNCDLLVDNRILVEIKAIKELEKIHFAQVLNYLKASDLNLGLLINFGPEGIKVKRIVNGWVV
ncbi:GxxExxY protein [Mongoliitalea daihaiensis]|uniref:GxxExxY protein n=1 Tax=Mongoliitalea daihaiensis TaxID=2782006 RepID=UPI001F36FAA3|nr:GxxExxY protein [Mongoliitalea daihaiensis]UJP66110.1 GxxExxY protein [Mongoliitalea daihaiensis]